MCLFFILHAECLQCLQYWQYSTPKKTTRGGKVYSYIFKYTY